jgi:hypothetical protein
MKVSCALGVTSLPAPASDEGGPEGVVIENIGGKNGVVVAAWDVRSSEVAGIMEPGDTCLHGTHRDDTKRAKVFCKENLLSLLVGDDLLFAMDNEDAPDKGRNKAVTLAAFGTAMQITPEGFKVADDSGSAWYELYNGSHSLAGPVTLGGAEGAMRAVKAEALAGAITTLATPFATGGPLPSTHAEIAALLAGLVTALGAAAASKQVTIA